MDMFALNAGVLDGSGVVAQFAFFPSSTATMTMTATQNQADFMSGSVTSGFAEAGNIIKLALLGSATITTGFTESATMSKSALMSAVDAMVMAISATAPINHGGLSATDSISLSETGSLRKSVVFGAQSDQMSLAEVALLTRIASLSAADALAFSEAAQITRGVRNYLPSSGDLMDFSESAKLNGTFHIGGSDHMALAEAGVLSRVYYLAGSASILFSELANVSINVSEQDAPERTMTVECVDTTMWVPA